MGCGAGTSGFSGGDIAGREGGGGGGAPRTANQGAPTPARILGDREETESGKGSSSQVQPGPLTKVIWMQRTREMRGRPQSPLRWGRPL